MVVDHLLDPRMDLVFGALADPTRRDIVRRVMSGPASVSALARHYPMSFAAVQKHVAVLTRADIVRKERHGREQLVLGNLDGLRRAAALLDELEVAWRERVDRIDDLLAEDDPATDPAHDPATNPAPAPRPRTRRARPATHTKERPDARD